MATARSPIFRRKTCAFYLDQHRARALGEAWLGARPVPKHQRRRLSLQPSSIRKRPS